MSLSSVGSIQSLSPSYFQSVSSSLIGLAYKVISSDLNQDFTLSKSVKGDGTRYFLEIEDLDLSWFG